MNTACRLIFASCLLLLGIGAGTSDAQVAGASGREEALPLDAPATQLEPVPSAVLPPVDSAVVRPEVRVKVHEVVEPPVLCGEAFGTGGLVLPQIIRTTYRAWRPAPIISISPVTMSPTAIR